MVKKKKEKKYKIHYEGGTSMPLSNYESAEIMLKVYSVRFENCRIEEFIPKSN